jgi:hypothetical protein
MVTKKKKTVKQQRAEQTATKEQTAEKTAEVKTGEKFHVKNEPAKKEMEKAVRKNIVNRR